MRVGEGIYNTFKQQLVFRIYKALLLREKRKRRQCRRKEEAKDFTRYFTQKKKKEEEEIQMAIEIFNLIRKQ